MNLNLHFLEAEGSLAPWRDVLQAQTNAIAARITEIVPAKLRLHPVDVAIQYLPEGAIPEIGMGGFCFRRGLVTISLDPGASCFEGHLAQGIFGQTLAHELHHALRWSACGYGSTLGEAFASEGLADTFAGAVTGLPAPPWTNAVASQDWPALLEQAERERGQRGYNHAAWFFGTGKLPRWAGYTIGYRLARLYSHTTSEAAATGMIDTPADAVLAMWHALRTDTYSLPVPLQ